MSDSPARGPRYNFHDGFRMPMGFPVAGFESGQRYRAAPGDVFVASYPKCGTTWTQYIVYFHTRGFVRHYDFAEGAWNTFFECFLRGEVDFGDYFDHLNSWWAQRSEPNVLFLTYERMLAEPAAAVRAIAEFLGGRTSELARDACQQAQRFADKCLGCSAIEEFWPGLIANALK